MWCGKVGLSLVGMVELLGRLRKHKYRMFSYLIKSVQLEIDTHILTWQRFEAEI